MGSELSLHQIEKANGDADLCSSEQGFVKTELMSGMKWKQL
jgi:hypothetical protein